MSTGSFINIIGIKCPPEAEDKFDKWYDGKHIPDMLKSKELRRVTRYRVTDAAGTSPSGIRGSESQYPRFVTIYEFKNRQAFEAWDRDPELMPDREEANRVTKEVGGELLWRVQYEFMRTWEQ